MMIVDATEREEVRSIMENELDIMDQRHEESLGIYEKAANYAPAFGMIGTLVGLVNMLNGMDMDAGASSNIGPAMATALTCAGICYSPLLATIQRLLEKRRRSASGLGTDLKYSIFPTSQTQKSFRL